MYTRTIAGKQEFSDCRTIQLYYNHGDLVAGQYVSNPSAQLIYDEGWREFTPEPQPQTEPMTDEIVSAVKKMLASSTEELSDEDALAVAALFPTWHSKIGKQVNVGERLWYNEKLWKVIQAHTAQENWTPDTAVSLYTEVSIEEWPEWRQPLGAQDAYAMGDKVSHNGQHWVSTMDANVYEPGVYGWDEQL